MFFSSENGISVAHLDTKVYCRIINALDPATIHSLCSFQGGVLFSDKSKFSLHKITSDLSVSLFADTETQGSPDGPVSSCQFMQPRGICTELDHVVYVCDPRSSANKLLSGMGECGRYLEVVRTISDAFARPQERNSSSTENTKRCSGACSVLSTLSIR